MYALRCDIASGAPHIVNGTKQTWTVHQSTNHLHIYTYLLLKHSMKVYRYGKLEKIAFLRRKCLASIKRRAHFAHK